MWDEGGFPLLVVMTVLGGWGSGTMVFFFAVAVGAIDQDQVRAVESYYVAPENEA